MQPLFEFIHEYQLKNDSLTKSDIIVATAHVFLLNEGFRRSGTNEMVNISVHVVIIVSFVSNARTFMLVEEKLLK